jgi:DNA-binding Lrp family transcriptional regulator
MALSDTQRRLIEGWQKDFPLDPAPYARIALALGVSERSVLGMLVELSRTGILSRVGAVVAPNTAGASTLGAMAVPPERLDEVARQVNAEAGVNHNYEREHRFNLWFVVTGRDRPALDSAIARISRRTGVEVLDLPLRAAYYIDLGFPLFARGADRRSPGPRATGDGRAADDGICDADLALLRALEDGLPIGPRPYAEIANRVGMAEETVIERLRSLVERGVIRRLGLVLRHRELGFTANAMVVWDIEDERVDEAGEAIAKFPFVTLCYQRARARPQWPYNLFCMIHGRDRESVLSQVEALRERIGPAPLAVLFSRRCFKQHGARLSVA